MKRNVTKVRKNILNGIRRKKFSDSFWINEKIRPLECVLYVEMKLLWKLLRLMGALPYVEVHETGNLAFHWLSTSMLYSALIIIALIYTTIDIFQYRINLIQLRKSDFDFQVFQILLMLTAAPGLFIQVTFWMNTQNFVEHVQNFAKFETNYNRVCKSKLKINTKRYCLVGVASVCLYIGITNLMAAITNLQVGGSVWYQQFPYFHVIILYMLGLPYFVCSAHIFSKISENIQRHFSRVLKNRTKGIVIQEYRLLYLQFRNLSRGVIKMVKLGFILFMLDAISSLTFGATVAITIAIAGDIRQAAVNAFNLAILYGTIYFFIHINHVMEDSVGKIFISNILKNRMGADFYGRDTFTQIKIFIKMLKVSDSKITSIGYFTVNHSTLISLMSLMSTYIIIMVQFRILGSSKAIHYNGTDTALEGSHIMKPDT